jgi:hypothetical protein
MQLKLVNKDRLLNFLYAIGYVKSQGYEITVNTTGIKCAVMTVDKTMNAIVASLSLRIQSGATEKVFCISDLGLFKKFIKLITEDNTVIDFNDTLNNLIYNEHILSLKFKEFTHGFYKPKRPIEDRDFWLASIPDNNALSEVLSSSKLGETMEIRNTRMIMGSWDMELDIADSLGNKPSGEFCVKVMRNSLKNISRMHKKIGQGNLYLKMFKDNTPAMICFGENVSYKVYCGIIDPPIIKTLEVVSCKI